MLLIANHPTPVGPASAKDWTICGDPQPYAADGRYAVIPSLDKTQYLAIDENGKLSWTPSVTPANVVQIAPGLTEKTAGFVEVERGGSMVFLCLMGLA